MIDVIVIGAGPAGSEIAFQLSKLGREVYVFERSRLDREKPCGGGIQAVELRDFGDVPDDVLERRISGARVISPRGEVLELTSGNGIAAATVKRAVYDRYLQERAAEAGAKVFGHCKVVSVVRGNDDALVTVVQDGNRKEFQAKLVVCAAGVNLQLLKRIGFGEIRLPTMFLAVEKWVALDEDAITDRFGNAIELYGGSSVITEGYGWIFPKRDVLSVGVGCTLTAMHQNDLRLKSRLRRFMFDHPIVKEKLSGGQIVHSSGGLIPVEPLDHLYADRVVLVGDSGGFGSRLHGGGIYQARKSAKICSLYADRFLDNFDQQHLRDYEVNVKREFWEYEGKWDGKLANFIWKDESLDLSISLANKSDPKLKEAYSVLLGSTESHQRAHEIFEAALLDLFSEYLREKAEPYRKMLESQLRSIDYEDPLLAPCVKHLLFSDAKRFRATLVFLAFELFSQESLTRVLPLAAAYELRTPLH